MFKLDFFIECIWGWGFEKLGCDVFIICGFEVYDVRFGFMIIVCLFDFVFVCVLGCGR